MTDTIQFFLLLSAWTVFLTAFSFIDTYNRVIKGREQFNLRDKIAILLFCLSTSFIIAFL